MGPFREGAEICETKMILFRRYGWCRIVDSEKSRSN
jgi:hypothetical protein